LTEQPKTEFMQLITTQFQHTRRIMKEAFLIFMLIVIGASLFAQSTGDYQTHQTGAWNQTSTWERWNGSSWVNPAPSTPGSSDGVIAILANHVVNIPNGVTVTADQITIASNITSKITIDNGALLILNNGSGNDLSFVSAARGKLEINGAFRVQEGSTINNATSSRITVGATGVYQHNYMTTAGTIYNATWNSGSELEIMGYTSNTAAPAGLNQAFYDFTWNCEGQLDDVDLDGALGSSTTIAGDLNIISTNNQWFLILSNTTDYTLNVGGDLNIYGDCIVYFSAGTAVATLNISGDFSNGSNTGSSPSVLAGRSAAVTLNVGGATVIANDLTLSEGSGTGRINVAGNFSHSSGAVSETSSGSGVINFNGTYQFFNSTGLFSNTINFIIASNSIVEMGSSYFAGTGSFTLSNSSEIRLGSVSGLVSGTGSGNIRVSGTRTFGSSTTIVYNGAAAQATGNGLPSTVYNLTVDNGFPVTLSTTLTVSNTLTLTNGILVLGNQNLTIAGTGAISGGTETEYIATTGNGVLTINNVGNTGTVFPIGTSASYNPCTINNTGTIDNISARVYSGTIGGASLSDVVNRTWEISEATPGNSMFNLTLQWNATDEGFSFDRTGCGIGHYSNGNWVPGPTSSAAGSDPYTQTRTGISSYSQFGIGDAFSPLPVELMTFTASLKEKNVVGLNWQTASERNNDRFEIEFSMDAQSWTYHGEIEGNGTVNTISAYDFNDRLESEVISRAAKLYYRLKQVDFNGDVEYSPVAIVSMQPAAFSVAACAPNPFNDQLSVSYQKLAEDDISLELLDLNGTVVLTKSYTGKETSGVAIVETADVPFGIYILRMSNGKDLETQKIIKQ
jgi:hypothetical protein